MLGATSGGPRAKTSCERSPPPGRLWPLCRLANNEKRFLRHCTRGRFFVPTKVQGDAAHSRGQDWQQTTAAGGAQRSGQRASTVPDLGVRGSGGTAQRLLFVLVQIVHVEIAMLLEPVLVGLDRQRPHQLGKMRTTWVRRLISSL